MSPFISLALLWIVQGLPAQDADNRPREIVRTADHDGMERCMQGIAGFSLTMQCRVDAEGRGRDCAVRNPTAASRRNDSTFQCMASKMRFHYSDGAPAEGEYVEFRLGGRTLLGEGEYARRRNERRQNERRRNEQSQP